MLYIDLDAGHQGIDFTFVYPKLYLSKKLLVGKKRSNWNIFPLTQSSDTDICGFPLRVGTCFLVQPLE